MAVPALLDWELDFASVRLDSGSHSSPREGVCVMELASLRAGEPFSDHPRCVCRVIGAFMRAYNDRASHPDRQLLVPYADRAIGTRSDRRSTRERRDICLAWAGASLQGGPLRRLAGRLAMRIRILVVAGLRQALHLEEGAGELAARVVFARHGTGEALELLDAMLAVGRAEVPAGPRRELEAAPLADPVIGPAQARVAAAIRQLAGDAQVAQGENGRQPGNHNGHAGHLARRDAGQADEEHVEDYRADDDDPERDTKPTEDLHQLARVP